MLITVPLCLCVRVFESEPDKQMEFYSSSRSNHNNRPEQTMSVRREHRWRDLTAATFIDVGVTANE